MLPSPLASALTLRVKNRRSLIRGVSLALLSLNLTACEHRADEDSAQASPPTLPSLEAPSLVRGALLGVWGRSATQGESASVTQMTTASQLEERVWFVGGARSPQFRMGDERGESSLIAVYNPASNGDGGEVSLHTEMPGGPLWWVWGSGIRGEVWAVGERGSILRLDESYAHSDMSTWTREEIEVIDVIGTAESNPEERGLTQEDLTKLVIWGVWGARSAGGALTLWAVGGSVRRGGPRGVLLKRSPEGFWRRVNHPLLPHEERDDPLIGLNLYKIWGREDEVWIVGEGGLTLTAQIVEDHESPEGATLRLDEWRAVSRPDERAELLFTVHGTPDPDHQSAWVVGGYERGRAWRWKPADEPQPSLQMTEGQQRGEWEEINLPTLPALNGVYATQRLTVSVGQRGVVAAWRPDLNPEDSQEVAFTWVRGAEQMTLHSIYCDEPTGCWIVGGDLSTLTEGVLITPDQWDTTRPKTRRALW